MPKGIRNVFFIIGTLVAALLIWAFVFGGEGGLKTAVNAVVKPVNTQYQKITGSSDKLIPEWGTTSATDLNDANNGF